MSTAEITMGRPVRVDPPAALAPGVSWSTVVLCALAMIAEGFDTYSVGFIGPALARAWQLPQNTVGQLYAVGVAASLFGSILFGLAADRVGRKKLLIGASLVFGLATLASAAADSLPLLMLGRVVTGLGLGASIPSAIALATEAAPQRYRATAPVVMSACIGAGVVVAGLTAAAVMPAWGWRGLLGVGGVLAIVLAVAMIPLLTESRELQETMRRTGRTAGVAEMLAPRMALLISVLTLGLFATYVVTFFLGFWLPTLIGSATGDVRTVGLVSAAVKTCSLFGSLTLGLLMDRFGMTRMLPLAFLAAAVALATTVRAEASLTAMAIGLGVASFFIDGAFSGIVGFAALAFPTRLRASGIGFTTGVARLSGGTLGPMLGGALLDRQLGVHALTLVFSVPLLAAGLMVVVAGRLRWPETD